MKILVVSDSHGRTEDIEFLKEKHGSEVAAMIHCGDSELEKGHEALEGFVYVKGNCDYGQDFADHQVKEVGGYRLLVTHGHLYNIGINLQRLSYKAAEEQADIVLFGHSHRPGSMMDDDGILYINPGSILLPRGRKEKTYCIIDIVDDRAKVEFFERDGKPVESLFATYKLNRKKV